MRMKKRFAIKGEINNIHIGNDLVKDGVKKPG
jgi:hypothetical protein